MRNADELLALRMDEQIEVVSESTGGVDIRTTEQEVNGGRIHVHFVSGNQEYVFSANLLAMAWQLAFVKWLLLEHELNGLEGMAS